VSRILHRLELLVDATLRAKIVGTRRTVEAELGKLSRFGGAGGRSLGRRFGAVAPKYRNSDNPSGTWAGRGLKARWLAAALKAGHKIEDFLIGGARKSAAAKTPNGKRKAAARKSSRPASWPHLARRNRFPRPAHGASQRHHKQLPRCQRSVRKPSTMLPLAQSYTWPCDPHQRELPRCRFKPSSARQGRADPLHRR
jgi:hypothetical protein